jgi:uncharacterized tellurite resistance protein B-like protein
MAFDILKPIRRYIDGNPSVRRVADDIELTSELVLLVRTMFADGELKPEEFDNFAKLCRTAFGIPPQDMDKVLEYLKDFAYEIDAAKAAAMFAELPEERKRALLLHMLSIARSDHELHSDEADLIRRTAGMLGVSLADLKR